MQQVAWPAAPAATPVVAFEMTNSKNDPSLTTAAHMARATLANEQEEAKLILSETVA
jgi:hypothetical protein